MPKQIRSNAFDMNCVAHQSPGLWTHPRDRADRLGRAGYKSIGSDIGRAGEGKLPIDPQGLDKEVEWVHTVVLRTIP
jgi:hypothetical protein